MNNKCAFATPLLLASLASVLLAGCASQPSAPVVGRDGQPSAAYPLSAARDVYTVRKGDTLYSIAREFGMDHRELIAMNSIENPNSIAVGRVLKVKPQGAAVVPISSDVVVARPISSEPMVEARPLASPGGALKREPKAGKEAYSDQALALAQNQSKPADAVLPSTPAEPKPEAKTAESTATWIWPASGKVIAAYGEGNNKGVDIAGNTGDAVVAAEGGKILIAKSHNDDSLRRYGNMIIVQNGPGLISIYAHNSKLLVKEGQIVSKGQKIAEMGSTGTDQVKLHFEVRLQGKALDPSKYLIPR